MTIRLVGGAVFCLSAFVLATAANAQSNNPDETKEATIFLERVLRPWSLVLENWTRPPVAKEWNRARALCEKSSEVESVTAVGTATTDLPPPSERYGSISFYRGDKGLQLVDWKREETVLFPNIEVGRSRSGAPAYRISGDGKVSTIGIGRVDTDRGKAIVMIMDGALFLSCRQPEPESR